MDLLFLNITSVCIESIVAFMIQRFYAEHISTVLKFVLGRQPVGLTVGLPILGI